MNGKNFTRTTSFPLFFLLFLLAFCAGAQNPQLTKKGKGVQIDQSPSEIRNAKRAKMRYASKVGRGTKREIDPTSYLTQGELKEWLKPQSQSASYRTAPKSLHGKKAFSPEAGNKLKALRKEVLAARHKKRPAAANARIAGTEKITLYVDQLATTGVNDGSTWQDAYLELAEALEYARVPENNVTQIWVAYGTYKPRHQADGTDVAPDDQNNAFVLVPGVKIYGGFIGNEISLKERDLAYTNSYGIVMEPEGNEYATILSGDFEGNDGEGEVFINSSDNAYHVVISAGDVAGAVLDGVIITGGYATLASSSMTSYGQPVQKSTGGGIAIYNSSPIINNVVIKNNLATSGGGIYALNSSFVLTNALVVINKSESGGIYLEDSAPLITNATIAGNYASSTGAVIYLTGSSTKPVIRNSIIYGNTATTSPNVAVISGAIPTFSYSIVEGSGGSGGGWNSAFGTDGTNNLDADPKFVDGENGNFAVKSSSPAINAGNSAVFSETAFLDVLTDVRGAPRIGSGTVDIGAIESRIVRFVDKESSADYPDGLSWNTAYPELADALMDAQINGDVGEIWVAWGIYNPLYRADGETGNEVDRRNAFVLVPGVKIYGGFYGDETSIADRSLIATDNSGITMSTGGQRATILSGDFNGDDGAGGQTFNSTSENAYHVVVSAGDAEGAVLDGVIIAGGNANDATTFMVNSENIDNTTGGGIALYNSSPTISNVVIRNNQATAGAAIYAKGSHTTLTNALIVTNRSHTGGIYLENAALTITNATIAGNIGDNGTASGAGFYMTGGATRPQIRNTIVYGNTAASSPNVLIESEAFPTFSYSIVEGSGGESWNSDFGDGPHSLDTNPLFSDAANGNFSPTRTSPAVNAGSNAFFDALEVPDLSTILTDVRGTPRIYNGTIDIGAIENRVIRFVNKRGNGGIRDGTSWVYAYNEVAYALKYAASNPVDEIWVAWGTYKPRYLASDVTSTESNNQDNAFVLVPGVKIYGGFSGDETSIAQRDLRGTDSYGLVMPEEGDEAATILSGDFTGDDGDGCSCTDDIYKNTGENAHHVVISVGPVQGAALDGVIIAGGNASSLTGQTVNSVVVDGNIGGGIALYNSAPTISNVVIRNNQASSGGAIFASASPFVLTNALVVTNQSHFGGIDLNDSAPTITNATIAGNKGDDENADGAGIRTNGNSPAQIRNTIVYLNDIGSNTNVSANGSPKPTFSYSIVEGSGIFWNSNFGVDGLYNSDFDPKFHDPESGSFGLTPSSFIAINHGNNAFLLTPALSNITTDVRGTARITRGTVDIGAIESLYGNLSSTLQPDVAGRLYVNKNVTTPGDGSSWANAVEEVADALFAATLNPGITEIWAAGGVYHPLYRADNLSNENQHDRFNAFSLVSGVKIYGGFAGTEAALTDRNLGLTQNASILSADFLNDDPDFLSEDGDDHLDENAYHVVYSIGTAGAVLDGFTVQGSNTLSPLFESTSAEAEAFFESTSLINESWLQTFMGSGIIHYGPDLTMSNLIVKNNLGFTGAIYLTADKALFSNSLVYDNAGLLYGAGITSIATNMDIINATVTENDFEPFLGGPPTGVGVTLIAGTSKISNSIIYGNYPYGSGSDFHFQQTGGDGAVYSHSIIGGIGGCGCDATGTNGGYNLDEDPLFTDVDNRDFSLQGCSPAINLGTNVFYQAVGPPNLSAVTRDLVGYTRINQQFVDAGAFEFQSVAPGLNGSEAIYNFTTDGSHIFESTTDCATELLKLTPTPEVILGTVTARIWLDNEVKIFNGASYVQRHFDIEPEAGKETSTATATLYFTQADFDNFNLHVDEDEYLPTGYDDGEQDRKDNLRIYQFHGKASDNSGNPSKYTGSRTVITPSLVEWNDTDLRWEVTFDVDGFSGFFAGTEAQSPLPVRLVSFGGKLVEQNKVQLDWKVTEQENIGEYIVEYSGNAKTFSQIGKVTANTLENTQYAFTDISSHPGELAYYRLKMMEMDGTSAYSRLISVRLPAGENMVVYPVPAKNLVWVDWKSSLAKSAELTDLNGRIVKTIKRSTETQQIDISGLAQGVYFLKMTDGTAMKLVKE